MRTLSDLLCLVTHSDTNGWIQGNFVRPQNMLFDQHQISAITRKCRAYRAVLTVTQQQRRLPAQQFRLNLRTR